MKISSKYFIYILLSFISFSLFSCEKEPVNTLTVSTETIDFQKEGGSLTLKIETNAPEWSIDNPATDWLTLSSTQGKQRVVIVTLTVSNKTIAPRTATLTINAGNAKPKQVVVTQPSSEYLYAITSTVSVVNFECGGGSSSISITTDAPAWSITTTADWLQLSKTSGTNGTTSVNVTGLENLGSDLRSTVITVSAEHTPSVQITVSQKGALYPSYNISPKAADATGMSSNAVALAAKIKLGWNVGNSLEALGSEMAWGNPKVTKSLIDLVKQSGFNAVRIPCAWNQYMENSVSAKIKTEWLNRVKEVVQYCVDNDMYVLLNIHWDGGWLENNCTEAKQAENNAMQKAFWEQIATHLRDFDEHLLFASANEPNVENATQMAVLNSYHQTFIDAVRATGGRNTYRVLAIQGPSTDIEKTNKLMLTLPTDPTPNRMMVEIHYYTPWNFCGLTEDATWGKMFYYWGKDNHSTTDLTRNPTWGEEATVDANFKLMKTQFVDKGIPVIMGEYAPTRRSTLTGDALTLHLASRAYYTKYVTQQAIANGILPFYWDNGGTGNNGCGIFNRNNNTVADQQVLDALIQGAGIK